MGFGAASFLLLFLIELLYINQKNTTLPKNPTRFLFPAPYQVSVLEISSVAPENALERSWRIVGTVVQALQKDRRRRLFLIREKNYFSQ